VDDINVVLAVVLHIGNISFVQDEFTDAANVLGSTTSNSSVFVFFFFFIDKSSF
jgi:hypothetical protein